MEKDLSQYADGIGPLTFESLRVISFPGGGQYVYLAFDLYYRTSGYALLTVVCCVLFRYGAISPCEMNEFSEECEAWEAENGPFQRGEFMMKRNK